MIDLDMDRREVESGINRKLSLGSTYANRYMYLKISTKVLST
jgi:hypothetical protein